MEKIEKKTFYNIHNFSTLCCSRYANMSARQPIKMGTFKQNTDFFAALSAVASNYTSFVDFVCICKKKK